MSVRKRIWKTRKGEIKEAWIVDYIDQDGKRHIETRARKKEADARAAQVRIAIGKGTHVVPHDSITVKEAAENWIKRAQAAGLERGVPDPHRPAHPAEAGADQAGEAEHGGNREIPR